MSDINHKVKLDWRHKYFVVRFVDDPYDNIDKYVCVPNSWAKFHSKSDPLISVAYPPEKLTSTRDVISNQPFPKQWKFYTAVVYYGSDSFSAVEEFIKSKSENKDSPKETIVDQRSTANMSSLRLNKSRRKHNPNGPLKLSLKKPELFDSRIQFYCEPPSSYEVTESVIETSNILNESLENPDDIKLLKYDTDDETACSQSNTDNENSSNTVQSPLTVQGCYESDNLSKSSGSSSDLRLLQYDSDDNDETACSPSNADNETSMNPAHDDPSQTGKGSNETDNLSKSSSDLRLLPFDSEDDNETACPQSNENKKTSLNKLQIETPLNRRCDDTKDLSKSSEDSSDIRLLKFNRHEDKTACCRSNAEIKQSSNSKEEQCLSDIQLLSINCNINDCSQSTAENKTPSTHDESSQLQERCDETSLQIHISCSNQGARTQETSIKTSSKLDGSICSQSNSNDTPGHNSTHLLIKPDCPTKVSSKEQFIPHHKDYLHPGPNEIIAKEDIEVTSSNKKYCLTATSDSVSISQNITNQYISLPQVSHEEQSLRERTLLVQESPKDHTTKTSLQINTDVIVPSSQNLSIPNQLNQIPDISPRKEFSKVEEPYLYQDPNEREISVEKSLNSNDLKNISELSTNTHAQTLENLIQQCSSLIDLADRKQSVIINGDYLQQVPRPKENLCKESHEKTGNLTEKTQCVTSNIKNPPTSNNPELAALLVSNPKTQKTFGVEQYDKNKADAQSTKMKEPTVLKMLLLDNWEKSMIKRASRRNPEAPKMFPDNIKNVPTVTADNIQSIPPVTTDNIKNTPPAAPDYMKNTPPPISNQHWHVNKLPPVYANHVQQKPPFQGQNGRTSKLNAPYQTSYHQNIRNNTLSVTNNCSNPFNNSCSSQNYVSPIAQDRYHQNTDQKTCQSMTMKIDKSIINQSPEQNLVVSKANFQTSLTNIRYAENPQVVSNQSRHYSNHSHEKLVPSVHRNILVPDLNSREIHHEMPCKINILEQKIYRQGIPISNNLNTIQNSVNLFNQSSYQNTTKTQVTTNVPDHSHHQVTMIESSIGPNSVIKCTNSRCIKENKPSHIRSPIIQENCLDQNNAIHNKQYSDSENDTDKKSNTSQNETNVAHELQSKRQALAKLCKELLTDMHVSVTDTLSLFHEQDVAFAQCKELYEKVTKTIDHYSKVKNGEPTVPTLKDSTKDKTGRKRKVSIEDDKTSDINHDDDNNKDKPGNLDFDPRKKPFVLPPEYDPKDPKWVLKYKKAAPGIVEILPNTGVFVNYIQLADCKRRARDHKSLARLLLVEIFSQNALGVCSLTGAVANAFDKQNIRPGLDEKARMVLMTFVENYGKDKGWGDLETQTVLNSLRSKIQEIRAKHNNVVKKK